jgi:benzaldehyde dehydrogenase (NAD)
LGGNSPFIVLEDADIDKAVAAGGFASFAHQGQICMAASRHLVHEKVAAEYVKKLTAFAQALTVGDPATTDASMGPLINERQRDRVHEIVTSTTNRGAKVETGGEYDGLFYRPTVLTGVTPDMPAFSKEIFGPIAPITTFRSDEEAVQLANMTEYGLAAAVHSKSLDRARAVARQLRSGMVHINDQTVACEADAPFGGVGASGNGGRFGGEGIVEEFTVLHWITERQVPKPYGLPASL